VIREHIGSVSQDEEQAELFVNLVHNGEHPMRNVSVRLITIPNGWSTSQSTTSGEYYQSNRTLHWATLEPGSKLDSTIVLSVPADRSVGEHTVIVDAQSDTHNVTASKETVEVLPEDTAEPTTSPPAGLDDEELRTVAGTRLPSTDTSQPDTVLTTASAPGFSVLAAFCSILVMSLLVSRRPE
jgi:hypothetical protein